jgi:hypothetical protein
MLSVRVRRVRGPLDWFQIPLLFLYRPSVCLSVCERAFVHACAAGCSAASEVLHCCGQILSSPCDTAEARHFTQHHRLLFLSRLSQYLYPVGRPHAPRRMASDMRCDSGMTPFLWVPHFSGYWWLHAACLLYTAGGGAMMRVQLD